MRRRSDCRSRSRVVPRVAGVAAAILLAVALCLPTSALAQDAGSGPGADLAYGAWDVLVLRPFGLTRLALGVVYFVPAAVLSLPGGTDNVEEAWDVFVARPGQQVFDRPLGDF